MNRPRILLQAFLVALQFLTIIPVNVRDADYTLALKHSLPYYPLIGMLIGAILAALAWLGTGLETNLLAVLVLTVWLLVTGALHLDGLADMADAWVGGHGDRERTLAIMKDTACGPVAVSTVVLGLLWKYVALEILLAASQWLLVFMVPVFARLAVMAVIVGVPYVRPGGLGGVLAAEAPVWPVWSSLLLTLVLLFYLAPLPALLAAALTLAITLLLTGIVKRRLGGMTGDIYGAQIEIVELGVLVLFVLLV